MNTSVWLSFPRVRYGLRRVTTMPLSGCSSVASPLTRVPVLKWPQSQIQEPHSFTRSPSVGQAKNGSVPLSHSKCSRRNSSPGLSASRE